MATHRTRRGHGVLEYKAAYCAQVVEFMARGYSLTAFAGEIGTSRANLMDWCERHSPFADAVARGQARRTRLLEDSLAKADASSRAALLRALRGAAPEEWAARNTAGKAAAAGGNRPAKPAAVALPDNGRGQT